MYLDRLEKGYADTRREAKDVLIERNLRLGAHIAKKYQNVDEDMEDLISIGTIGLIKAIDSFDAGKGKLSTYASRCIDNELLMLLRAKKKTSRQVDIVERMEAEDQIGHLPELIRGRLSDREKQIIVLRYGLAGGQEVTQREIGKRLGISRSYVSRIEKRALEKLKNGYEAI